MTGSAFFLFEGSVIYLMWRIFFKVQLSINAANKTYLQSDMNFFFFLLKIANTPSCFYSLL